MIKAKDVTYEYYRRDPEGRVTAEIAAIKALSLSVGAGEFVGVLGGNGAGKTTLARLFAALEEPTGGVLLVDGMDVSDEEFRWNIRSHVGLVMQNPEDQMLGTLVEDDVVFGMENLGVDPEEMESRLENVLAVTGLTDLRKTPVLHLSGGQKQMLAIAGILAMEPRCIIFDEATSMLPPEGRQVILDAAKKLCHEGITVVYITHHAEEVVQADKILLLDGGMVSAFGTPTEVFGEWKKLREAGVDLPAVDRLALSCSQAGLPMQLPVLTLEGLVSELHRLQAMKHLSSIEGKHVEADPEDTEEEDLREEREASSKEAVLHGLVLDHVTFSYEKNRKKKSGESKATLKDVSLSLAPGDMVALLGNGGAGKSTLLQIMDGLLEPRGGSVYYRGEDVFDRRYPKSRLRKNVGLVFQYPERQFFGDTVYEEVSYGPKRMGWKQIDVQQHTFDALRAVGLSELLLDVSPYLLSGGEQRLLALACVLAMDPELLLLDEPTAGLDGPAKRRIFLLLQNLRREGKGILFVTHDSEEAAEEADRVIVLKEGEVVLDEATGKAFGPETDGKALGIVPTPAMLCLKELKQWGYPVPEAGYRMTDVKRGILRMFEG